MTKPDALPYQHRLKHVDLTPPRELQTLVENRRIFNLKSCELNIFESYQQAYHVPLTFNDFVITSMVRGKKIMHLPELDSFEYLPGETVIVPANQTMVIDFPEAETENPTQCIALAVDGAYLKDTLLYLNEFYNSDRSETREWRLHFSQYHFENDNEVTELINRLIRVCSSGDRTKNIYADLNLKELLIRLVQSQYLLQVSAEKNSHSNTSRMHHMLHYIHENLSGKISVDTLCRKAYLSRNSFFKTFREQFGMTPVEYINIERIKLAKRLLANTSQSITETGLQCGFADVNYFVRAFKRIEGITPGGYQKCVQQGA